MTNGSLGIPLLRYAAVNKLLLGNDSQDGSYSGMLKLLSNSSWQSDGVAGGGKLTGGELKAGNRCSDQPYYSDIKYIAFR